MPAIIPEYKPDDDAVAAAARDEANQRMEEIRTYTRWRIGDHPNSLKVERGQRDHNVKVNVLGQMVDNIVSMMGVPAITSRGGINVVVNNNLTPNEERTPLQIAIDAVTESSEFNSLAQDIHDSGLTAGHIFIRLLMPEEGEPSVENPVRLALLNPMYVTVFWNAQQLQSTKDVVFYRLEWRRNSDTVRQQDIVKGEYVGQPDTWLLIEREIRHGGTPKLVGTEVWPYPFAPILDAKAMRNAHHYYGKAFMSAWQLNETLNYVMSNIGKILYYHAHPTTVGINVEFGENVGADQFIQVQNMGGDAQIFNLTIDANGIQHSLKYMQNVREYMFAALRVVDPIVTRDKIGHLTNFGLQTLYLDMRRNVDAYEEQVGRLYKEAIRRALVIMNVPIDAELRVLWPEPLPIDHEAAVRVAGYEKLLGFVSDQTLANSLGLDYMVEIEQMREEVPIKEELNPVEQPNPSLTQLSSFGEGRNA